MSKVICTLPNASDVINGVKFVAHKLGAISEEIAEDVAAHFTSIKGYVLDGGDIEALRARATELGIDVNSKWKQDRLTAEIEKAEAKKADEAAAAAAAANGGAGNTNPETTA